MSGHEIPGCFPESVCDACQREWDRLRRIEAAARALVEEIGPNHCPRCFMVNGQHRDGCEWQALVAAVRGEDG